ncbi:MAG TPA: hypothetical protein VF761_17125 [Gemmatimonadaceae bacterium]
MDGSDTAQDVVQATIIETPEELRQEIVAVTTEARGLVVTNDEQLAKADAIRARAKKVITAIQGIYKEPKADKRKEWLDVVAEENFMLAAPTEVVTACDGVMKPYLREQEIAAEKERKRLEDEARREAEDRRRQEAEAARREAEERAQQEREEAERRAEDQKRVAAELARKIEEEALQRADELERAGKKDEAAAVLRDAEQRRDNVLDEAKEVVDQVKKDAEDVAARTEAEGRAIAEEIASAPVQRMHVAAPAAPRMASSSAAKTYKCDRVKAVRPENKLRMLKFIVSEAERGNWGPMAWVDHNFGRIDSAARDSKEMFPAEETSGLDVGLDVGIRSKSTKAVPS